jgi:hypothetical protein
MSPGSPVLVPVVLSSPVLVESTPVLVVVASPVLVVLVEVVGVPVVGTSPPVVVVLAGAAAAVRAVGARHHVVGARRHGHQRRAGELFYKVSPRNQPLALGPVIVLGHREPDCMSNPHHIAANST